MKRFTKIFVAVLAGAFALSCATDLTEDLGVKVDGGHTTEITLSLEESRTQLGEKADGVYPLYWSYDDKISVNGIESGEPAIKDENPSSATFTVPGELAAPYCIAYPAAPAGQVLFAENQTHAGNSTFGSGVTTMYAYSNGKGATLNHLTGVLKIGVTGPDNTILVMAQISTADRAPIAGPFNIDFETGELEATDLSKAIINYNIPPTADADGMLLSTEPQYIHVAVPAGVYDELYVTLYDAQGGVMYATIKADEQKPLAVGKVREFTNAIAYAPNAEAFIIKDADSLREFASQAATSSKDVLFVADVDMTGSSWTPIEGYSGTIFGNGYAIKGLTAPLFGTTNASFKGLHLVDVDINETKTPNVAPFARHMTATAAIAPKFEHCSASGKIVVDCQDYVYQGKGGYIEFAVGGIVGYVYGVSLYDCVSHVDIEIKQFIAKSNTTGITPNVGGIVGSLNYYGQTLSDMVNCTNYGDIKIGNGSDNGTKGYLTLHVGGCIGVQFNKNWAHLENVANYGNITVDATFTTGTVNISGVVGYAYSQTINNFRNYGNITWNSGTFSAARISGVISYCPDAGIATNLANHGDITVKEGVTITGSLYLGGVFGYHSGNATGSFTNCENNGDITIDADMADVNVGYFRIGGIGSWSQCAADNFVNNGDMTISSRLNNYDGQAHCLCIGGIVGYKTVCGATTSKNTGDITFSGSIDANKVGDVADVAVGDVRLNIGGCFGYATYFGSNFINEGNIEVSGANAGAYRIGGLGGHVTGKLTTGSNSGNVTFKSTASTGGIVEIGGLAGYMAGGSDLTNTGNVTLEAGSTVGAALYVGGIVGYNNTNAMDQATNSGEIKVSGTSVDRACVAGIVGTPWNAAVTNATNTGAVTVNGTITGGAGVGGIVGYVQDDKSGVNKNLVNEAPISVSGTSKNAIWVGGVIGNSNKSNGQTTFENKATGIVTVNLSQDSAGDIYVGGVGGLIQDSSSKIYNYGNINVNGYANGTLYIGGVIGSQNNYDRTDHFNYADINVSVKAALDLRIGGICAGGRYAKDWKNAVNYGDINVSKDTEVQGSTYLGGIYGSSNSSQDYFKFTACRNEGNITFSGKSCLTYIEEDRNILCMGGLTGMVGQFETGNAGHMVNIVDGFTNKGTMKYDGTCNGRVAVGGIIGNNNWTSGTWSGTLVNEGEVICTGTYGTTGNAGGIIGISNTKFADVKAHCSVKAKGYTGVGMILGSSQVDTIVVSNAHCGGLITANSINADGDKTWQEVAITQENYVKYIYAAEVDDALALANYCGFLSAIDATPVYSDGSAVVLPEPAPEPETPAAE